MKRFIDLRHHYEDIISKFAWYDTITDKFESHNGNMAWHCWDQFCEDYDGKQLERYRRLTPEWAFNEEISQ